MNAVVLTTIDLDQHISITSKGPIYALFGSDHLVRYFNSSSVCSIHRLYMLMFYSCNWVEEKQRKLPLFLKGIVFLYETAT